MNRDRESSRPIPSIYTSAGRLLGGMLIAYGLLTALSWTGWLPGSSSSLSLVTGQPWSRVLIREVASDHGRMNPWTPTTLDALPGAPFPLDRVNLTQQALAGFIQFPASLTPLRRAHWHRFFQGLLPHNRHLLVYRVDGALADGDVQITCTPVALMTPDSLFTPPGPLRVDLP